MKINDFIVAVFIALGGVSEINWVDVPFWIYLALGGIYLVFRIKRKGNKTVSLFARHVGNHPKKPPGGGE